MIDDTFYYNTDVEVEVPIDVMIGHLESIGYEVIDKTDTKNLIASYSQYRGSRNQIITHKLVEAINNCEDDGIQDVFKGIITTYLNIPFDTDKETICKLLKSKL